MSVTQEVCDLHLGTSVFMIVPIIHSAKNNPTFATCLFITFVASVLNWSNFVHGSLLHMADRLCVCLTIGCVCVQNQTFVWWLPTLLFFFACGKRAYYLQSHMAVYWHCAFRYIAFWMCYLHAGEFVNVFAFGIYTISYGISVWDALLTPHTGDVDKNSGRHD